MEKINIQELLFSLVMVIFMVYGMVVYNIACESGLTNQTFIMALGELPIMGIIVFLLETLIIGNKAKSLAFKMVDPKTDKPIVVIIAISSMIVLMMCPTMSLIGSLMHNYTGISNIFVNWLRITVRNFPMALCYQIFICGPFVRWIFSHFKKEQHD